MHLKVLWDFKSHSLHVRSDDPLINTLQRSDSRHVTGFLWPRSAVNKKLLQSPSTAEQSFMRCFFRLLLIRELTGGKLTNTFHQRLKITLLIRGWSLEHMDYCFRALQIILNVLWVLRCLNATQFSVRSVVVVAGNFSLNGETSNIAQYDPQTNRCLMYGRT